MWEGLLPAVGVILVVVGPGSGLYIATRRGTNGAVRDIAEIKEDLKSFGKAAQEDRTTMLRGLDGLASLDNDVTGLSTLARASHDQLISHRHRIEALEREGAKGG